MSFEGQDTPSPLLVGWRTAKSTTSGTSLLRRFTGGESSTGGESFPFCQDIHHHSSTQVLSFSVTLDPNDSMAASSWRNVLLRHHTHPCLPFDVHLWPYIYTWASTDTTSIFMTSTEVLSIVVHTSSSNMQSCLVCRLKGKTLLLPYL